jgi:hypothetical protein
MARNLNIFKALVSNAELERLYQHRQKTRNQNGVRTRGAVLVCLALLFIATTLLVATAWVPHDVRSYLATRSAIFTFDEQTVSWRMDQKPTTLATIDTFVNKSSAPVEVTLDLSLPQKVFSPLSAEQVIVVSLPGFNFHHAKLFRDGQMIATYLRGQAIQVRFEAASLLNASHLNLSLVLEVLPSERSLAGIRNHAGVLVGSPSEFERYRDFLGAKSSGAAGKMGHLTKIVLALFCLLLFLIVDSSPESFGLALFMGLEAAAMGIGEGWMPLGLVGIDSPTLIVHYFYQMGDLLKLYFLFQVARLGSTNAMPWLVAGTIVSIPYAFFMLYAADNSIAWAFKIARTRDTIVGGVGALVCLRAFFLLRGKGLPWRQAALLVAASAAAFEVINTWIAHSDLTRVFPAMKTTFTVLQANCGYLFALSTFLNISTLENRVKSLTKAKARADEIEREMEIGQIVQKSLLKAPELPDGIAMACHHEAALYVSGDTYYANWDKKHGIFTFLVNDVTGHGVQAALKASACNVLAKTIWENDQVDLKLTYGDGSRLAEFDRVTDKLLVEMNSTPDFNSLIGAEFTMATGELVVYRSNFTFPILITPAMSFGPDMEPVLGEFWKPEVLICRNREITRRVVPRGSFLLFLSDGFMESSRDSKLFAQYMRQQLSARDTAVDCGMITEMVLKFDGFSRRKVVDDRTLLVFQWTYDFKAAKRATPEQSAPLRVVGKA